MVSFQTRKQKKQWKQKTQKKQWKQKGSGELNLDNIDELSLDNINGIFITIYNKLVFAKNTCLKNCNEHICVPRYNNNAKAITNKGETCNQLGRFIKKGTTDETSGMCNNLMVKFQEKTCDINNKLRTLDTDYNCACYNYRNLVNKFGGTFKDKLKEKAKTDPAWNVHVETVPVLLMYINNLKTAMTTVERAAADIVREADIIRLRLTRPIGSRQLIIRTNKVNSSPVAENSN
jgi:hypothetical protein